MLVQPNISIKKPVAILLMGPTASGKTALAQALYDVLPCCIINVDSAQFYRGMDIGSAKLNARELARYPHRMLDFLEPHERYSVGQFRRDVLKEIQQALALGKIPLLVGGSILYFKTLVEGIDHLPPSDLQLRQRLERAMQRKGLGYLHRWLSKVDPQAAQRLHPNDPQRILRALEVYLLTGQPLSDLHSQQQRPVDSCRWLSVVLFPERRDLLHHSIAMRFEQMLEQGFAREVEKLHRCTQLSPKRNPALRAVGYRQMWDYLEGSISYENMRERAIIATRQFAKRQCTWLRSWPVEGDQVIMLDNSDVLAAAESERVPHIIQLRNDVLTWLSNLI